MYDILRKTRTMTSHEATFEENGRLVTRFFFSFFFLFIFSIMTRLRLQSPFAASCFTLVLILVHSCYVHKRILPSFFHGENYLTRQRLTLQNFFAWLIAPILFPSVHSSFICLTLQCIFYLQCIFRSFWKIMSSYYSIRVTCTNINSYYRIFCVIISALVRGRYFLIIIHDSENTSHPVTEE